MDPEKSKLLLQNENDAANSSEKMGEGHGVSDGFGRGGDGQGKIPYKLYALIAFLTVGTIGCSNTSLAFLNYPTQVIFKCCKLIPVMAEWTNY